jgi:hypothetical protein
LIDDFFKTLTEEMTTMTTNSKKSKPMNIIPKPTFVSNPNTIPVSTTGLIWIDENRWAAAAFLACFSEYHKIDINLDLPRAKELVQKLLPSVTGFLCFNVSGLSFKDADKLLFRALTKTRVRSKKMMAQLGGDVLDFPNEFVDLYADIVVDLVDLAREKIAKERAIAA